MHVNLREYGDLDNLKNDIKLLRDIFDRQGTNFIIDVLAERVGEVSLKFKFTSEENKTVVDDLVKELKEQLLERI